MDDKKEKYWVALNRLFAEMCGEEKGWLGTKGGGTRGNKLKNNFKGGVLLIGRERMDLLELASFEIYT